MIALILFAAAAASTPPATDSGHCDSKPFTLKKPAAVAPAPAPAPKPAAAKAAPKTKVHSSKYVIGCKQPKS